MPERYNLNAQDRDLLQAATILLKKAAAAETLRPAELVSVARLQHVLSVLPRVTADLNVTVQVTGPRREFGEIETWHYWEVAVEGDRLSVSSGGHFHQPSTGGDGFTTMNWSAMPEEPSEFGDYRPTLRMVPDVQSFPDGVADIDFGSGAYKIEITDSDNELLEEEEDTEEDTDDEEPPENLSAGEEYEESESNVVPREPWSVIPLDAAEKRLAAMIDPAEVDANEAQHAYNAENCGSCGCLLSDRGLFVDGRLRGQPVWGNMCANCFESKGDGIGWGRGQLYARQSSGSWRFVAGFRR
jgi:hypothetical protein